jgi:tetratricopeptide (TPR) repeat protein
MKMRGQTFKVVLTIVLFTLMACGTTPPVSTETTIKKDEPKKLEAPVQDPKAIEEAKQAQNAQALEQSYQDLLTVQTSIYEGKIEDAIRQLKVITQRNPEIPEAHYNLAVLEERLGLAQDAQMHYQKAIEAKKDFSPAWLALTLFYLRNQDVNGALSEMEQKLRDDPTNIGIRNARIRILLNFPGKEEEIIREAKLILREDEQNTEAMISLASAYDLQKKHELAIAILENAKALSPNNPEIFARLSRCYENLGETLKARLILEETVGAKSGATAEIHNQLGLIYHQAGDYIGATDQFQRALSLWPNMVEAQLNLGNALKGQQKFQEASLAFQQSLQMKANLPEAYYNLGILYIDGKFENIPNKVDQLQQAIQYLNDYLKYSQANDQTMIAGLLKEAERLIEVEKKKQEQRKADPPSENSTPTEGSPSTDTTATPTEAAPVETPPSPTLVEPTPAPTEPTPAPIEPTPAPTEPTPQNPSESSTKPKDAPKEIPKDAPQNEPKEKPKEESPKTQEVQDVEL